MRQRRVRRMLLSGCVMLAAGALVPACGAEAPADYTAETRSNFLAACTDPLSDSILLTQLCECAFETAQARFTFDRFVEIEDRLRSDLQADLGNSMNDVLADCILREADL